MAEILARTFIIAFVLIYSALFLALAGWSIRRALRNRLKRTGMTKVVKHLQRLGFLHHARGDLQQVERTLPPPF